MTLAELRMEIDAMNRELVVLLGRRTEIARQIARVKKKEDLPTLDLDRERTIKDEVRRLARANRLSVPIVEDLFEMLLDYTRMEMDLERLQ